MEKYTFDKSFFVLVVASLLLILLNISVSNERTFSTYNGISNIELTNQEDFRS